MIIVPLVWVRQLERLAFFHIFGNFMVILVMITVVVFSVYNISENDGIDSGVVALNSANFSLYFGKNMPNTQRKCSLCILRSSPHNPGI